MENKSLAPGKNEIKSQFIEMRARGFSIRAIARELGLSPQTITNWHAEMEEEIARLKAIELEALYEEFHLLKTHRLKRLGERLAAIEGVLPVSVHASVGGVVVESADNHPARRRADDRSSRPGVNRHPGRSQGPIPRMEKQSPPKPPDP